MEELYKSKRTLHEILVLRGYKVEPIMTYEEWCKEHEDKSVEQIKLSMDIIKEKKGGKKGKKKILVTWPILPKLGTNIRDIYQNMEAQCIQNAIIVIEQTTTPNTKSIIKGLKAKGVFITIFTISETQFNITNHVLVDKHEICSPIEREAIIEEYGKDNLPQIKITEPYIRYLGAKKGQLIKITKESETQIGYNKLYYRIVS